MAARSALPTLTDDMMEVLDPLGRSLFGNLTRVDHLVQTYKDLYGRGRGRRVVFKTDLLRAAVVFMHATLEDLLRTVALSYLPDANQDIINRIPLAGGSSIHAEKFWLGRLVEHRGKTVDNLINESIKQHLQRRSFNDTNDISELLTSTGFLSKKLQRALPALQGLMKRRHQIVHQLDRSNVTGRGQQRAASISVKSVERWNNAVKKFGFALMADFASRKMYAKFVKDGQDAKQLEANLASQEDEFRAAIVRSRWGRG